MDSSTKEKVNLLHFYLENLPKLDMDMLLDSCPTVKGVKRLTFSSIFVYTVSEPHSSAASGVVSAILKA